MLCLILRTTNFSIPLKPLTTLVTLNQHWSGGEPKDVDLASTRCLVASAIAFPI